VIPLLGKINDDQVTLNLADTADTPAAVKDKVPRIESDVFLEISNRFVYRTPGLVNVAYPDVLFQVAVICVLLFKTLDDPWGRTIGLVSAGRSNDPNRSLPSSPDRDPPATEWLAPYL